MRTTTVDKSKRTPFTQHQPLISTMIQTSNFSKERKHGQISKENKKTSRVISRLSWDVIQAPPKSKTPFSRIELTGRQQPRTTKCHKMWSLKRSIKIKWTISKKEAKKKGHLHPMMIILPAPGERRPQRLRVALSIETHRMSSTNLRIDFQETLQMKILVPVAQKCSSDIRGNGRLLRPRFKKTKLKRNQMISFSHRNLNNKRLQHKETTILEVSRFNKTISNQNHQQLIM